MNIEQEKLLDKLGIQYNLGSDRAEILNRVYRPSKTLNKILETSYTSELGILKSIYYQEPPAFLKNILDIFQKIKIYIVSPTG